MITAAEDNNDVCFDFLTVKKINLSDYYYYSLDKIETKRNFLTWVFDKVSG